MTMRKLILIKQDGFELQRLDKVQITNDISNDYTEVVVSPGDAKKIDRSNKIF